MPFTENTHKPIPIAEADYVRKVINVRLAVRLAAVVTRFLMSPEAGQTLIEYGLMLTLLAMAAVAALGVVGDDVRALFTSVETQFRNASTP